MMTQAQRDFAPILAKFPEAILDDDGSPLIRYTLFDAEWDPISVSFDSDGIATFDVAPLTYFMLRPEELMDLGSLGLEVRRLMSTWFDSDSGKAWAQEHA